MTAPSILLALADVPELVPLLPIGAVFVLARDVVIDDWCLFAGMRAILIMRDAGDPVVAVTSEDEANMHGPSWRDLALDLSDPRTAHDLARAIGERVGLDVSRGVTWTPTRTPFTIFAYSGLRRFSGLKRARGWMLVPPLCTIDPLSPTADREALIVVARQLFGGSNATR